VRPPARTIPSIPTTISNDRSIQRPTRVSASTPIRISRRATTPDRSSSSPYLKLPPSSTSATASGPSLACSPHRPPRPPPPPDTPLPRIPPPRRVPARNDPFALPLRQQRNLRHTPVRIQNHTFHHPHQTAQHPVDRGRRVPSRIERESEGQLRAGDDYQHE